MKSSAVTVSSVRYLDPTMIDSTSMWLPFLFLILDTGLYLHLGLMDVDELLHCYGNNNRLLTMHKGTSLDIMHSGLC